MDIWYYTCISISWSSIWGCPTQAKRGARHERGKLHAEVWPKLTERSEETLRALLPPRVTRALLYPVEAKSLNSMTFSIGSSLFFVRQVQNMMIEASWRCIRCEKQSSMSCSVPLPCLTCLESNRSSARSTVFFPLIQNLLSQNINHSYTITA